MARRKLPDRRRNKTWEARIGGCKVFLTSGEYEDGTIGEIFVKVAPHDASDTAQAWVDQWARATSYALQCGLPLEELADSFIGTAFDPCGVVESKEGRVRFCRSIPDWAFKELAIEYLGAIEYDQRGQAEQAEASSAEKEHKP